MPSACFILDKKAKKFLKDVEMFASKSSLAQNVNVKIFVEEHLNGITQNPSLNYLISSRNFATASQEEQQSLAVFCQDFKEWLKTHPREPIVGIHDVTFVIERTTESKDETSAPTQDVPQEPTRQFEDDELPSFVAVSPKYRLEQIVLPDTLKQDILSTLQILKNYEKIYRVWGFEEVDPNARAVLNFYGPPGTGKTMTAHALAHELGCKILVANFAEIESKYVGEAPKNLSNIFRTAEEEKALLFFDEADSFLGKRIQNVSSSSDQSVNSLRSHLLQLLEEHRGAVVFCTNLVGNYDKAFQSRILRSIKFELPTKEAKACMLKKMIPARVPEAGDSLHSPDFLNRLADIAEGFSGRELKNAVLQTLCTVVAAGRDTVNREDFIQAFEKQKNETEQLKRASGQMTKSGKKEIEATIKKGLESKNTANTSLDELEAGDVIPLSVTEDAIDK